MNFSTALTSLKAGNRICRSGWNGKKMYLKFIRSGDYSIKISIEPEIILPLLPWIGMKTADCSFVPWLASQTDILADDWEVI